MQLARLVWGVPPQCRGLTVDCLSLCPCIPHTHLQTDILIYHKCCAHGVAVCFEAGTITPAWSGVPVDPAVGAMKMGGKPACSASEHMQTWTSSTHAPEEPTSVIT